MTQSHVISTLETPAAVARRKLVLVIPAFNEEENIGRVIHDVKAVVGEFEADRVELLVYVVDDGSEDRTREQALGAGADRVLRHKVNQGLGAAVRTGLAAARAAGADIVVKMDADMQHDPEDLRKLVQPILDDEADVVYGDRTGGFRYQQPLVRRWGNKVFTWLMRTLTGWPLRDSQPGILAVSKSYLEVFHLPGDYNYTQQILLDAYHKHMRFAHAPVTFRARTSGASFVSLRYPFKTLPQIVMMLVSVGPMKVFGTIGIFFLGLATVVFVVELGQWVWADAEKPVRSVNLVLGSSLFGLQALFFGLLAQLIVNTRK